MFLGLFGDERREQEACRDEVERNRHVRYGDAGVARQRCADLAARRDREEHREARPEHRPRVDQTDDGKQEHQANSQRVDGCGLSENNRACDDRQPDERQSDPMRGAFAMAASQIGNFEGRSRGGHRGHLNGISISSGAVTVAQDLSTRVPY